MSHALIQLQHSDEAQTSVRVSIINEIQNQLDMQFLEVVINK